MFRVWIVFIVKVHLPAFRKSDRLKTPGPAWNLASNSKTQKQESDFPQEAAFLFGFQSVFGL